MDLKRKKSSSKACFCTCNFLCLLSVLHVPVRAQAITSILLGSLDTLVFTMIYGTHGYFFRFSHVMLLAFSQSKIRTPKKSGTPQRFWTPKRRQTTSGSNLRRLEFKTILVHDIFNIFLCGLSIDFMKTMKAFWTSFFGTLGVVLKQLVLSTLN